MPRTCPKPVLLLALAWLLALSDVRGQATLLQQDYDKSQLTKIQVESVFTDFDRFAGGFLPVRVTIRNSTTADRVWTVRFNTNSQFVGSMTYQSQFRLPADSGPEVTHDLLVPIPPKGQNRWSYNQMVITVTSPGLQSTERNHSMQNDAEWPSIGISKTLAERSISGLNTEAEKLMSGSSGGYSGANAFGSRFIADDLPSDWRGYSALDSLLLTSTEWLALAPGQRRAIREWMRLGGTLYIYKNEKDKAMSIESLGFPESDSDVSPATRSGVGFGKAVLMTWDGKTLNAQPTARLFKGQKQGIRELSESYDSGWGLQTAFDEKNFSPFLVVLLLIVFGVLVGPVNLFVWAKPGQRQRMFITTPIISLAACLLIGALIFLSDGVGGSGRRAAFVDLQTGDGENRAFVIQEQISRAGVLFSANFEVEQAAWVAPVLTRRSQWNRIDRSNGSSNYEFVGNRYAGDWFQSRSEQGQYLQSVVPTRSRVELQAAGEGDNAPQLFSSLEYPVDRLVYFDEDGTAWDSQERVTPGSKILLKMIKSDPSSQEWWTESGGNFSAKHRRSIRERWGEPGHFVAISSDEKAGLINTLASIRWKHDLVLVTGPVSTQSALGGTEEGGAE